MAKHWVEYSDTLKEIEVSILPDQEPYIRSVPGFDPGIGLTNWNLERQSEHDFMSSFSKYDMRLTNTCG